MIIRSIHGKILYRNDKKTIRRTLEQAVIENVDLQDADLRRSNLSYADLDGLHAPGACFWGSSFNHADLAGCDLEGADMRNSNLNDACLAETNFKNADFSGSYFNQTILRQCTMTGAVFTTPDIFSCDFGDIPDIARAIYRHRGETDIPFGQNPIIMKGLSRSIVVLGNCILWGDAIVHPGDYTDGFEDDCLKLSATIEGFLYEG